MPHTGSQSAELPIEDILSAAGERVLEALEPNEFFQSFQIEIYDEHSPASSGNDAVGISYVSGTIEEPIILVNLDFFEEYFENTKSEDEALDRVTQLIILTLVTAYYEGLTGSSKPMPAAELRRAVEMVLAPFLSDGIISFAKFSRVVEA
ncbi:hypothetical protein EOI86_22660 [Hwanghaeella grinnelliae]|uniref:Uncharacterized protein n=1 Tax=Hwanghaeella grinnelliae TaxID=2500179 RepID=A0A3S2W6V6_9PROT|nr:hypothetical protein [Hwanghaeella grinnelliae]RVU33933.1 hypothetical protein EOI86_22660 [Hwanghaeella grinnelliae]